jgi:superfamily I DNA and/or RNA helicase
LRTAQFAEEKTSLVVLTPYNEQARQLTRRIGIGMKARLAHLKDFKLRDPIVHTIDSFQGDEADIVVASLVRNNRRGWYRGLGILGEAYLSAVGNDDSDTHGNLLRTT